ncbi:MAG: peptide synthetase [Pseudonocardiales bacterium]|nr:peptide synthetase [Pseudonocardiales bacterium]
MARFCARVRKRADLPSVSIKDVYQHPTIKSLAAALPDPAPALVASTEQLLAEVLAEVVGVERVSVDRHFFDDLGADSMVMARFCARVRKRADLPSVSIKDVYQHPTIKSLATALAPLSSPQVQPAQEQVQVARRAGSRQHIVCGALQFLIFLGYSFLTVVIFAHGLEWIADGSGPIGIYLRSALFGLAYFVGASIFPILVKWALIGRWKPQQIPIWSLAYLRFWVVKALVQANPLFLFFRGSPLYVVYLRALGAKIGRSVVIFSQHVPVCTDLLTIGENAVIRKDSFFNCYRAHSGMIQTGPVTIGKNVLVGEATVLDIDTALGDGAQLGHASSLHTGQAVPKGERWHGSPAERTEANYRAVETTSCGILRKVVYTVAQLLKVLALYLPLVTGGAVLLFTAVPWLSALNSSARSVTDGAFYVEALVGSFVLYLGGLLVGLLFVGTVPRVLNLFIKPDKVYPLYGFHYGVHRLIARMTNHKILTALFGDSSFIVCYLRWLGYRLTPVRQTGSNFGTQVKHETPYLVSVGSGTVCASELSIVNADYSSTSFRVSRARIGAHSFLGNLIAYPSQSKTGDNCLLGTKVLVPIDGTVRENVGLLGSPSFEIPRTVARDNKFIQMASGDEYPRRLAAKNKHNLVTIGLHLLGRWSYLFGLFVILEAVSGLRDLTGDAAAALASALLILPFTLLHAVLIERTSTGFRGLRPTYCSIYQRDFWRVERFFKNTSDVQIVLNGTPFKSIIWRFLGVRLGKRLYDDGCGMGERNMVTIGDDVTLNAGCNLQCHSQEDYAFKSDYITIGSGCTIGVGAMVYYGATMRDGAVLAPDSFLMKGEEVPPDTRWGGNPAREMPETMPRFQIRHDNATTKTPSRAHSNVLAAPVGRS